MAATVLFVCVATAPRVFAQESAANDAALAREVRRAPISLARGLSAAHTRGTPISAKFELEDGKPQLSVYTAQDGHFWEVIINHRTGRIAEAKEIKEGEDLAAAKSQREAMTTGKRSLNVALRRALRENPGSRVVSVVPSLSAGRPVAAVRLVRGKTFKTVSEALD
ncbi:MAG TPA: PepSY domain-containing protein [Tepidiformaceae bacterium]|nr:PepSY domain-containing protein [Tepidiformaceae bacterium]